MDDPSVTISAGTTYCQSKNKDVTLESGSDTNIIFIDHVAYGRPFFKANSVNEDICTKDMYAKNENDYCVATNSLAAVTYWCQGKKNCKVLVHNDKPILKTNDCKDLYYYSC